MIIALFFAFFFVTSVFAGEIISYDSFSAQKKISDDSKDIHNIIHLRSDISAFPDAFYSTLNTNNSFIKSDLELAKLATKKDAQQEDVVNNEELDQEKIELNFENMNLSDFIHVVASKKNINYYLSKDIENLKLPAIKSYTPKTIKQLWELLLTFIKENGLNHEERNGLHIFTKDGQLYPLFSSKDTKLEDLANSDQTIRYLFYLKNLKADFALQILNNFLNEKAIMIGDLDVLLLKEKSRNIKIALSIIEGLDIGGIRQSVTILPLKYTDPESIAKFLNDEINGNNERIKVYNPFKKNLRYFSSDVRVFAYPEKQSLVLLGQSLEIDRIIHFIKLALDTKISQARSRVHIKEIRYQSPEELKNLLKRLVKPTSNQDQNFKEVDFVAETPSSDGGGSASNRLIVACNNEEWVVIEKLIEQLDKPAQSLAIEIMLVDTALDMQKELSSHLRDAKNGFVTDNASFITAQAAPSSISGTSREYPLSQSLLTGANVNIMTIGANPAGIFAPDAWALIRQISNQTNSAIVYQPSIVVRNNETCIWDQQESKIVDGALEVSGVKTSRPRTPYTAVTRASVTPRLNLSGLIDLSVEFTISEFVERSSGTQSDPDRTSRTISTKATIGLGEVLALAGFDRSKLTKSKYEVPILGSIPIIGTLFRSTSKRSEKQQMYAFIRVSAMKQELQDELDEYSALKVKYAKYQLGNINNYSEAKDPILKIFLKPRHSTVKESVSDYKKDRFALIDDFVENKDNPLCVSAEMDTDFYARSTVDDAKKELRSYWVQHGFKNNTKDPLSKLKSKRKKAIVKVEDIRVQDPLITKDYLTPA